MTKRITIRITEAGAERLIVRLGSVAIVLSGLDYLLEVLTRAPSVPWWQWAIIAGGLWGWAVMARAVWRAA